MDGGDSGIAADGTIKTYMLAYGHGFAVPKIRHRSRMPSRSFRIISDGVVATVVIFLLVRCALQLAGKRSLNAWSQGRLAEQASPCEPRKTNKSPNKRREAPRERQREPRTPYTPPESADASAPAESVGNDAHHQPSEEPRGRATPTVTEATAAAGGEQAEQAEAPEPDGPSGATGSVLSAGREDQKEEGQGLPDPCAPPTAAGRKGVSADGRRGAAQWPRCTMPFRSAGTAGVGGYSTGSEGGTTQQPGHPAYRLPTGAEGAWADSRASSIGGTQQLVFPLSDMPAVAAEGGESGEQPAAVPEQPTGQRMPDSQGPERPAGSRDAQEPQQKPATPRTPAAALGSWEAGGAQPVAQADHTSADGWGSREATAAGERAHLKARAAQRTAAVSFTEAAGPLLTRIKRAVTSVKAIDVLRLPGLRKEWPFDFPLIGESNTVEDLNGVLLLLQSLRHHRRPGHSERFTTTFRGFTFEITVSHEVASPNWPDGKVSWATFMRNEPEWLNGRLLLPGGGSVRPLDDVHHTLISLRFLSAPQILHAAAKYMQNFFADVTALFENGDSRSFIERDVPFKTEQDDNIVGSATIRLVGAEWVARWEHKEQLQDGGGNSS
ncbi:uncharacterized protein EMH_0006860 [Eimeria mitis]|uniref:Uncharacterized protein n=1 Tax=Eimeria mitis TaxID=44415 RepID=U6JYS2_9EIME|nr:uncharacterized protein EMH_0006860 [Eimeria mitis]CDJ30579.1 hypothetical protein EMH_0006860 [Eimeria mitis]